MISNSQNRIVSYLRIFWKDDQPYGQIFDQETDRVTSVDLITHSLTYQVISPIKRICVNYDSKSENRTLDSCEKLVIKGRKCGACNRRDNIYAAQFHNVHTREPEITSAEILKRMERPNILYIAGFFDGSIKVGTSASVRVQTRLLEQGAIYANLVAETPDGISVRILEDLITEKLGIGQAISTRKKIDGLLNPLKLDALREIVNAASIEVERCISSAKSEESTKIDCNWENEHAYEGCWANIKKYPNSLSAGSHDVKVASVIGKVAALDHSSGMTLVADLDEILGLAVELGEFGGDQLSVQEKLF